MKLEVLCHDSLVASILRKEGWRECIDEANLPKLEEMLRARDIPAELIRESDYVRVRVRWGGEARDVGA